MSSSKSSSRRHCHKQKCCFGPTGPTGAAGSPGTNGTNGVTGPTGPALSGYVNSFSSGTATAIISTFSNGNIIGVAQNDLIIGVANHFTQGEVPAQAFDSTLLATDTMVVIPTPAGRLLNAVSASWTFTVAPVISSTGTPSYTLYAAFYHQKFGTTNILNLEQTALLPLTNPLNLPPSTSLTSVTPPIQYTTLYGNLTLSTPIALAQGDKYIVAFFLSQLSGTSTSLSVTGYGSISLNIV